MREAGSINWRPRVSKLSQGAIRLVHSNHMVLVMAGLGSWSALVEAKLKGYTLSNKSQEELQARARLDQIVLMVAKWEAGPFAQWLKTLRERVGKQL